MTATACSTVVQAIRQTLAVLVIVLLLILIIAMNSVAVLIRNRSQKRW
ncbi:hypothetical protein [Nonomuraea maheshkhaliensis]